MEDLYYVSVEGDVDCMHRTSSHLMNAFHCHGGYQIYLLLQGNILLYVESETYQLKRGALCILSPGERHRFVCLNGDEVYERTTINSSVPLVQSLCTPQTDLSACFDKRPFGKNNVFHLCEQDIKEFMLAYYQIEAYHKSKDYGSDVIVKNNLSDILLMINNRSRQALPKVGNITSPIATATITYIEDHLLEKITLDDIAASLFLNSKYVNRTFKKATGLTISQFIISRRIALAKLHLARGTSTTETCYRSGFGDYSNFLRTFKKQVGIPPGAYQKSAMEPTDVSVFTYVDKENPGKTKER